MRSIILFYYQCPLRTNNNQTSCHKSSVKSGSYSEASVKTKIMEIIELPLQVQRYLMNTIIIFNCHPRRRFRKKKKKKSTNKLVSSVLHSAIAGGWNKIRFSWWWAPTRRQKKVEQCGHEPFNYNKKEIQW